jgi:hypothetical protein
VPSRPPRPSPWPLLAITVTLAVGAGGCGGVAGPGGADDPSAPTDDDTDGGGSQIPGVGSATLNAIVETSPWIPTSVTARWSVTGDEVVDTWLEYSRAGEELELVDAEVDGDASYHVSLIWLRPGTAYRWSITAVTARGQVVSALGVVETGAVPVELPELTAEWIEPEDAEPPTLVTTLIGQPFVSAVIDAEGTYRWWYAHDAADAKVTRSRLSRDHEWMLMLVEYNDLFAEGPDLQSDLVRVRLDGTALERWPLVGVHQDFVELADGTLALLAFDTRDVDGVEVVGDTLVEMGADGDVQSIWNVWDHAAYDPELEDPWQASWSHANALDYDEADNSYRLSLRNLDTIMVVYRETGEVTWRLGGSESDVKLAGGDSALYTDQHQFELVDDTLLVFDNGPVDAGASRAVEYALDPHGGTATETWAYSADPPLYCYALGDVARLGGGNVLVTWSTAGRVDEVTPAGDRVWTLTAPMGWGFGYVEPVEQPGGI